MYISTSHRPAAPAIAAELTDQKFTATLGHVTLIIGDARIHLTADEANRLHLELTGALHELDAVPADERISA